MSFILFVRSAHDLDRACREAGALLAFRRHAGAGPPAGEDVLAIWLTRHLIGAPLRLSVRPAAGDGLEVCVTESFGMSGIWELGRIEPVEGRPAGWAAQLPGKAWSDALTAVGEATGEPGVYAPVFSLDTPPDQVADELRRLRAHDPAHSGVPAIQDPRTGRLFLLRDSVE
ncbi:MAG: hypothetical protein Q8O42_14415 [Acidobacteriota bacterium]|nr:hypothetical protein [Acidobacteriota bacterium]